MKGVLICGHGRFAEGILSGLQMIAGNADNVRAVCFTEEDTSETLMEKIESADRSLAGYEGRVVFCDLAGGSPFQMSAMYFRGRGVPVIGGASTAMILEVYMLDEPESQAVDVGRQAVKMINA